MPKATINQPIKVDLTSQNSKNFFDELNRLSKSHKLIRRINHLLYYIKNEKSFFEEICSIIMKTGYYKFVYVSILDKKSNRMDYFSESAAKENFVLPDHGFLNDGDDLPELMCMKSQQIFILNDLEKDFAQSPWKKKAKEKGFKSVISLPIKIRTKIIGSLNLLAENRNIFDKEEISFLKEIATNISIGVKSLRNEEELKRNHERYKRTIYEAVDAIALISERRDPYTGVHQRKVALLSSAIAEEMKLEDYDIEGIYITGLLHDIGKNSTPLSILSKPSKLNEPETMIIRLHSQDAYEILKSIEFPWPVAQTVLQHHERLNGSGYPNGLKGSEIILNARILGVADVIEAMSSHRPYRPAVGLNKALKEVFRNRNILFDPKVVDACLRVFNEKKFEL
ncbi:MAG: HD domain-containing protein [Actinomycetota bacterium]|nr:HD domain-containing protein [Actinomycetota bacterium]